MKRVLVTGASGFVGRACLPVLLANGWEVHAVSSRPVASTRPLEEARVSGALFWHEADLLDCNQTRMLIAKVQPEYLLHLAWVSTVPGGFWNSPLNFRWVAASLDLLRAFGEAGGRRVVTAGTCAEYDWASLREGEVCKENITVLRPATPYGTCKHALQLMLEAWAESMEVSAAWGRVFFLYGPQDHPSRLVSATIRALLNGVPARCSTGLQVRDFLHVDDAAAAFVALLQSEVRDAVNIASGQPLAVKDVVNCIGDLLQRRDLIELGALPFNADEPSFLVADTTRLHHEVGWSPRYEFEVGLQDTINWWRGLRPAANNPDWKV